MTVNSKALAGWVIFILVIAIISAGCSSDVAPKSWETAQPGASLQPTASPQPNESSQPKVIVEGSYKAGDSALLSNPVATQVHVVATNVGNSSAENVSAVIQISYSGKTIAEESVSFGTVNNGTPVTRDIIMKLSIPSGEWPSFKMEKTGMKISALTINGTDVRIGAAARSVK